jgi:hypothetical protein
MADTVVQELVINRLTQAQFDAAKKAGTLSPYELYGTPDTSVRLPVLTPMWFDHIANDVSWLRADTFSWQSGDVYVAAYEHLVGDLETAITLTDTIGDITITYYLAEDGHKICLPDQESNLIALYEATGIAWYYLLDTANKQFKLPRTKWGFTGLRDSVGGIAYTGTSGATPDYSSGKTISSGWVAEYDCVGYCDVVQSDGVAGTVYVDGKAVYNHSGGGYPKRNGSQWFVPKGSKVTYSGTWAVSPTVYPLKTVYDKTPATQMYLYFYVGNFEQSAVEQTAGITAETLNGKADAGFGNVLDSAKELMAGASMPSGTYTDLTLGSSGTVYTAPADGYFYLQKGAGSAGTYVSLSAGGMSVNQAAVGAANSMALVIPVKAGKKCTVNYNATGSSMLRFIYADGAKHLA